MEAPLLLTALGAPIDVVCGGSRGGEIREALASRWSLCSREEPRRDARTLEVFYGDEQAHAPLTEVQDAAVAGADLDRLLVDVTHRITWSAIDANVGSLLMFHAAGFAHPSTGAAVVCVAPGGTGKTTLCRTLAPGRAYLSDETVGVGEDGTIRPYPKPLSVRREGRDKDEVAPTRFGLTPAAGPAHPVAVLLLAREDGAADDPVVESLDLFDAIVGLTPETSSLARLPQPLHRLASLLESVDVVARVRYRDAAALEPLVADLIGTAS